MAKKKTVRRLTKAEQQEASLQKKKQEIQQLHEQRVEMFRNFATKRPELLSKVICEAMLEIEVDGQPNLFSELLPTKDADNLRRRFRDFAAWDLARREAGKDGKPPQYTSGDFAYVKVAEWAAFQGLAPYDLFPNWITSPESKDIVELYFRRHSSEFSAGYGYVAEYVYRGMPIYRRSPDGVGFEIVSACDRDYSYLFKKGEYAEWPDVEHVPTWAPKYYMRVDHMEQHRIFFAGGDSNWTDEGVSALRKAFRQHVGLPDVTASDCSDVQAPHQKKSQSRTDIPDEVNGKTRTTYQWLIAGLAKYGKFDLTEHGAATTLAQMVEDAGGKVTDRTIRTHLTEISSLIRKLP